MFKITPDPTFKAEVQIPLPGGGFAPLALEFKALGRKALRKWIDSASAERDDAQYLGEVVVGWSGVGDANGSPLPFSIDALAQVLDGYWMASKAIFDGYLVALTPAGEKN